MNQNATKQPSKAARCVEAYEKLRASSNPGRPYNLAKLSREELIGLYLSAAARTVNELELSAVERVAMLELLDVGDGLEAWRRVFGDGLVELVQEVFADPPMALAIALAEVDGRRFVTEEEPATLYTFDEMCAANSESRDVYEGIDALGVEETLCGLGLWVRRVK